tara:strand:+ start:19844 stop:20500 length:657 start_codon:yes stop_codon:yes gene_type:complete
MAKKRKDQRFELDESVEKQVFSLLDNGVVSELSRLRAELEAQIAQANKELQSTSTDLLAQSLSQKTGRRGEASFQVDPDGKLVLVVSYGGETTESLSRTPLKPAWNKKNERKPKAKTKVEPTPTPVVEEPKPKKKGFIKTSVAVSETKILDIDELLDGLDEPEEQKAKPENDPIVYENAYTPSKKRLRRIPGQPVQKSVQQGKTKLSVLKDQKPEPLE